MEKKKENLIATSARGLFRPLSKSLVSRLLLVPALSQAGAILSTSKTSIGINNEGDLIYRGVGLRYVPTNGEALAPGCPCEGWGIADLNTRKYAKAGRSFGRQYVTVESFTTDGVSAKSIVNAAGIMRVTHDYTESNTEHLFRVLVTIENISDSTIHLLYRRAMDWDVPPTTFSEMVTIVTNGAKDVIYTSDNGFADGNPLNPAGKIAFEGEATDNGPRDHGAVFDFDFGNLEPGKTKEFVIYYGAAKNEEESINALAQVGAEVYSLGKPNPSHPAVLPDGTPNTFIFGFGGVGGKPIIRPLPDFTLGGLKVIDNGLGQPLDLEVRIGNAGHKDSEILDSVNVSFYDGDPALGGILLGVTEVLALAPGHFQDVRLSGVTGLSGTSIFAMVDAEKVVAECREKNNSQQIPFSPAITLGTISVSSDALVYSGGATAQLGANISNTGFFDYELNAQLIVEDGAGFPIQAFPVESLGVLASGTSVSIAAQWPTAGFVAGDYRVHGILTDKDGIPVSEAFSNFRIDHDYAASPAASLRIATDKQQYHVDDTVAIESTVGNLTNNVSINDAVVELAIENPAGSVVYQEVIRLDSLVPAQLIQRSRAFILNQAAAGQYRLNASLVGNDGFVFATDSTIFEVVNDLRLAIRGTVTAQKGELYRGETQICDYRVENTGIQDAAGLPVTRLVVNIADQQVVFSESTQDNLQAGGNIALSNAFSTRGYALGEYACVLQTTVNGEDRTLAYAQFDVLKPPISLEIASNLGDRGRILILMDSLDICKNDHGDDHDGDDHDGDDHDGDDDCEDHDECDERHVSRGQKDLKDGGTTRRSSYDCDDSRHCDDDDDDDCDEAHGHDRISVADKKAYLAGLLDDAGWSYTIVHSASDFKTEFYSGQYAAYGLFAERVTLKPQLEELLIEAVNSGEGLLINGAHNRRNNKLEKALGIHIGGHRHKSNTVVLPEGSLSSEWPETLVYPVEALDMDACEADTVAYYQDIVKHGRKERDDDDDRKRPVCDGAINDDAAVTRHPYGLGKGVFIGFDALEEAALEGSLTNAFADLIRYGFSTTHPERLSTAGNALPLRLLVENTGMAVHVRMTLSAQSGGVITAASEGWEWINPASGDGYWQLQTQLAEEVTVDTTVYAQLAGSAPYTVMLTVEVSEDGVTWEAYDTQTLRIDADVIVLLSDVLTAINELISTTGDKELKHALKYLNKAEAALNKGDYEQAVQRLIKAVTYLEHPDAQAIRLGVDAVLLDLLRKLPLAAH